MDRKDVRITYAAARVNKGLLQKDAAKQLNISEKTLIVYESGKVIPQWDRHKEMSALYEIPEEMLCSPRKS